MFTVQFNNLQYLVRFDHYLTDKEDKEKRRFNTRCRIRIVNNGVLLDEYFGYAKCNPCDLINKAIGKKYALQNVFPNAESGYFPKEVRALLFNTLFDYFKVAKTSPLCRKRRI